MHLAISFLPGHTAYKIILKGQESVFPILKLAIAGHLSLGSSFPTGLTTWGVSKMTNCYALAFRPATSAATELPTRKVQVSTLPKKNRFKKSHLGEA